MTRERTALALVVVGGAAAAYLWFRQKQSTKTGGGAAFSSNGVAIPAAPVIDTATFNAVRI